MLLQMVTQDYPGAMGWLVIIALIALSLIAWARSDDE